MKNYILKEYGSWGVLTLSYIAGLLTGERITLSAGAAYLALGLFINAKQALLLWLRRPGAAGHSARIIFFVQISTAAALLAGALWNGIPALLPYAVVPVWYIVCLGFLGEHSIVTEIAGFMVLTLAALIGKFVTSGSLDGTLYASVAVFFVAGVFRVRVQLKKRLTDRIIIVVYCVGALLVYSALKVPVIMLIPLCDNVFFALTLYRIKLRHAGWLELTKGLVFVLLMAMYY